MSNFNIGDKVIYLPTKDEGKIIAMVGDINSDYIYESSLIDMIRKVPEEDLKLVSEVKTPAEEFAKLDEKAKQFRLMQTMQRCQEIFAMLEAEGKIDSEKVSSIDWYDESKFKIELCIKYEETYCGTDMYEEDYTDSTEQFFRVKLLERFGKPKKNYYQCSIVETHTFNVKADSEEQVKEWLEEHENDDLKDYLLSFSSSVPLVDVEHRVVQMPFVDGVSAVLGGAQ